MSARGAHLNMWAFRLRSQVWYFTPRRCPQGVALENKQVPITQLFVHLRVSRGQAKWGGYCRAGQLRSNHNLQQGVMNLLALAKEGCACQRKLPTHSDAAFVPRMATTPGSQHPSSPGKTDPSKNVVEKPQ